MALRPSFMLFIQREHIQYCVMLPTVTRLGMRKEMNWIQVRFATS